MPSQGSAGFMSGFTRSLFPGLSRGAEHLASGWRSQDEFERAAEQARQAQEARRRLAAEKQAHDVGLKERDIEGRKEVQGMRDTAADERLGKRIVGDKEVAGIYSKAGITKTAMGINEDKRSEVAASLQRRLQRAEQMIEEARQHGPVSPETLKAIEAEAFKGLTAAEADLVRRGDYGAVAAQRGATRSAEDQMRIDQNRADLAKERTAGQAAVKLIGDPTIKYTNPAIHTAAVRAAEKLLGGVPLAPPDVAAAAKAFEEANGRRPASADELKAFLGAQ